MDTQRRDVGAVRRVIIGAVRRAIIGLGRPWVFWPSLLFLGALNHGPDGFGSTLIWLAGLALAGPVLSLGIYTLQHRRREAITPGLTRSRAIAHFRGIR
ncbi:MAG: hypothetical protein ABIP03_01135 [Aquihabitans sp.]